jgi:hypothetical protein
MKLGKKKNTNLEKIAKKKKTTIKRIKTKSSIRNKINGGCNGENFNLKNHLRLYK